MGAVLQFDFAFQLLADLVLPLLRRCFDVRAHVTHTLCFFFRFSSDQRKCRCGIHEVGAALCYWRRFACSFFLF